MNRTIKNYYEDPNQYLAEHQDFFSTHDAKKDIDFLVHALEINKNELLLDIACGQGRHTTELAKRGYRVSGVDFAPTLIKQAKDIAKKSSVTIDYYVQDVEKLILPHTFDVVYWFFSDFAHIDLQAALNKIATTLKPTGRLMIDADNYHRLIKYLKIHPESSLHFDAKKKILVDLKKGTEVPYPDQSDWETMMTQADLQITTLLGNYDQSAYTPDSPRLIVIAKKRPRSQHVPRTGG